jgi:hypothetical protein
MKRHMILAVAAVLAVAAAGPAFADPGSGGRNRGSETQNHDRDRDRGWDDDDWDDDDDRYDRNGGWRHDRPGTPRIDRWEERLEMRIRRGFRSGALTRQEASRLRNQLAQIHRQEANFKRDGRITARERQILASSVERLSFRIDRELADRQERGSRYGRRG